MVKSNGKTERLNSVPAEQRILAAARAEFIAQGLKGARMQAIADRAGVNKALLHYYFRSKEKLYNAALAEIVTTIGNALRSELGEPRQDEDLRSLLRQVVAVYVRTLEKNRDFPRFIARELIEGGGRLREIVGMFAAGFGDIPARIYSQLTKGQKRGTVRSVEPLHAAINIAGMCVFAFLAHPVLMLIRDHAGLQMPLEGDTFTKQRIESIVTMACDGLFKEKT